MMALQERHYSSSVSVVTKSLKFKTVNRVLTLAPSGDDVLPMGHQEIVDQCALSFLLICAT